MEEKYEGGRELLFFCGDYFFFFVFLLYFVILWRLFFCLGEESVCWSVWGGSIGGVV